MPGRGTRKLSQDWHVAWHRAQATEAARPVSGLGCVTLSGHLTAGPLCPCPHQEWTTQGTPCHRGSGGHSTAPPTTTLAAGPSVVPRQAAAAGPPQAPACPLHQAWVPTLDLGLRGPVQVREGHQQPLPLPQLHELPLQLRDGQPQVRGRLLQALLLPLQALQQLLGAGQARS